LLGSLAGCDAGVDPTGGNNAGGGNPNGGSTGQFGGGSDQGGGTSLGGDPKTCEEAAQYKTYLGCDFYPTVMANNVWSVFDFAAVVANGQSEAATVTVTGNGTNQTVTVPANGLATVYLPWVPALKGPDADACGSATPLTATVRAMGAFHLVSSIPVTVYQFSALEYAAVGGPPGKDWSSCPASQCFIECFSYSNDASLLLPSTAQTGNFRVLGYPGWSLANIGSTIGITGLENGTNVTVTLSGTGQILAGGGVPAVGPGGVTSFMLAQGEVVELVGTATSDFSGSLIQADKPIQVIHGMPCRNVPDDFGACDHIEESVFPAETLGQHYVVPLPTGPNATAVPHTVRFYGNVDGTTLTYAGGTPPGAPTTLNAGQVADLGQVSTGFEVTGSNEFAISTFIMGTELINPGGLAGDPSQSVATAVEQFRSKYVFLAPTDYDTNFADVISPPGTTLVLDGAPVTAPSEPVSPGYVVTRVPLQDTNGGSHLLTGDQGFGIQVVGYGQYTSYMYPGGLNLELIAPPPPPPE
jgi:hypothetical protein